jgi:hypothetical protein
MTSVSSNRRNITLIDLETGDVVLYKCRRCVAQGKTLFDTGLYYHHLSHAFNHLVKVHGLKKSEVKAGTPKLWTHYLKHIQYILTDDHLEDLQKLKKTREKFKKAVEIVKNALETVLPNEYKKKEVGFPPSLRLGPEQP